MSSTPPAPASVLSLSRGIFCQVNPTQSATFKGLGGGVPWLFLEVTPFRVEELTGLEPLKYLTEEIW